MMSAQMTQVNDAAILQQQDTLDEPREKIDKMDEPKETSKISDDCQDPKESSEKVIEQSCGHTLKALLELNLDSDLHETVPLGALKSATDDKREELKYTSDDISSKLVSSGPRTEQNVNTNPQVSGDPFSRAVGSTRDQNIPLLDRMMSNGLSPGNDPGYGSLEHNRFANIGQDVKSKSREDLLPPLVTTRPSDASISHLDVVVANAMRNLQTLQEQRASALASNYAGLSDLNNNDPHNLLSRLLTGTPQLLPQASQLLPQASQLLPQTSQLLPHTSQLLPQASQLLPQTSPLLPQVPHFAPRPPQQNSGTQSLQPANYLENAARSNRSAAVLHEAACTWSGQLPPRSIGSFTDHDFSHKVFLGGIPWDISEESLLHIFGQFGAVRVEWPGRDITTPPRGYLYITFDSDNSVKDLLSRCNHDVSEDGSFYYYKISSNRMRSKEVQVIPWAVVDTNFVRCPTLRLDPLTTVFVGALHGMINAEGLAIVFNDLFGGVVYAGLDTDKHKYPIGSGRVTFNNAKSYMKAVTAAFIEIKTPRFSKKVQVDPYLEDALCHSCGTKQGPYFCRDLSCFNYFCRFCWEIRHAFTRPQHKPLMRHIRGINRERWETGFREIRSGIPDPIRPMQNTARGFIPDPMRSIQNTARGFIPDPMRSMQNTAGGLVSNTPILMSHMATPSREPSSHMARPSREPSSNMATSVKEINTHMARISREPASHMATPSRENSGLMATPSRENSGLLSMPSRPDTGFTRWNPRKDAPEFDPVLPRSKARENQRNTPLTLDIFINNVMRKEAGAQVSNEKETKNGSPGEEKKETKTNEDVEESK